MNPLKVIGRVLAGIGKGLVAALKFAESRGLTDDLVDIALQHVTAAQVQFPTNEERFAFAVNKIKGKYVPESIARLAVELAVQKYKAAIGG